MRIFPSSPRWIVIDALAIAALAAACLIVVSETRRTKSYDDRATLTRSAVQSIQSKVRVRSTMADVAINPAGFPIQVDPAWFEDGTPENALAPGRPWIEIADESEWGLRHPRNPTLEGGAGAMFWYNPALGIVRARVPRTLSDADAIDTYNRVNGTAIRSLVEFAQAEDRDGRF
jgi:hypothetical protein